MIDEEKRTRYGKQALLIYGSIVVTIRHIIEEISAGLQ